MKTSILALLTIALVACDKGQAPEVKRERDTQSQALEVITLGEAQMASSVRIPGELLAFERVDLFAKVSSFVKSIHVDVGSEVKKGDRLAALEAPELNAQLAEARSQIEAQRALHIAAKANYDRLLETAKTPGTISANDLEQAQARTTAEAAKLKAAEAGLQAIASTRNYLEMRAPFSGVITARNVSPGAYVGPSGRGSDQPLFVLQEQARLRLTVLVPEANVGDLANGAEISFSVKSHPGQRFSATVARRAGALDRKLRAERIEMNVDNANKQLYPDMVAEVQIPLRAPTPRVVIPKPALLRSTKGTFVIAVRDQKAAWVGVQVGREVDGQLEIFGEVKAGETVIARANEELRDGSPVSTQPAKAEPAAAP